MLAEMHQERERINEAIAVLERIAYGRGRSRGRPPAWMTALAVAGVKRIGRPLGSKNKPRAEE